MPKAQGDRRRPVPWKLIAARVDGFLRVCAGDFGNHKITFADPGALEFLQTTQKHVSDGVILEQLFDAADGTHLSAFLASLSEQTAASRIALPLRNSTVQLHASVIDSSSQRSLAVWLSLPTGSSSVDRTAVHPLCPEQSLPDDAAQWHLSSSIQALGQQQGNQQQQHFQVQQQLHLVEQAKAKTIACRDHHMVSMVLSTAAKMKKLQLNEGSDDAEVTELDRIFVQRIAMECANARYKPGLQQHAAAYNFIKQVEQKPELFDLAVDELRSVLKQNMETE